MIDLHNLRLYLRPPGTGRRAVLGPAMRGAGLAEIPFTITGNALAVVNAEINGATGAMIVDTGKSVDRSGCAFGVENESRRLQFAGRDPRRRGSVD